MIGVVLRLRPPNVSAGIAMALAALACPAPTSAGRGATNQECRPVEERLAANTDWDSLAGRWRLTLVATAGPMPRRTAQGSLTLRAQDSSLRRIERAGAPVVTVPIIGATDLALEQVGAVRLGNLMSIDPRRPGVSVWVTQGPTGSLSAVMRIGQEEIRGDLMRFDGGYTALYVRHASARGIYGGWASGITGEQVSGHFCAIRERQ